MIQSRIISKQRGLFLRFPLIILFVLVLVASTLCYHKEAYCAQATVAWDPESISGLAGYKVYYGTASRSYSSVINAGNQTTATITGLAAGTTYYFAATAYNTSGTESSYSNEVAYTVPASSCSYAISPASASYTGAATAGSVTVTTSSGCTWTTANTTNWITVSSGASGTGTGTVNYSVSTNTGSASRTAVLTIAGTAFTVTQSGATSQSNNNVCAAAPSAATLVSPSGTIHTATPTYKWNAVPCSSWYYLWVQDSAGIRIQQWYTAASAGCASGTGVCSVTPNTILNMGSGQWWVQTWDNAGYGPWSTGMSFRAQP